MKYLGCTFQSVVAIFLLAGCSEDRPPDSAGRSSFQKTMIENKYDGRAKLVSYKKINASRPDANHYVMEFEVIIEFLVSDVWGSRFYEFPYKPNAWEQKSRSDRDKAKADPLWEECKDVEVQKKDRATVKGAISFEKTEKGWRGPDGNIY